MAWWGKVLGGAFGFMLGGPLGALLGASLGHQFDAGMKSMGGHRGQSHAGAGGAQERVQAAFFTATFAVMGHIAKSDGRVSRDEIRLAEEVMRQMQLNAQQRNIARALFNQGKDAQFEVEPVLLQFRQECHRRSTLIKMFMEIQVQAALADGQIAAEENAALQRVAIALGVAHAQLQSWIDAMRGGQESHRASGMRIKDAHRILGVDAHTPLTEVRKRYRRLLSQHHPDKLVAKGLPEEMLKLANQKTHEIRSAWEMIKNARQNA